MAVLDKMLSIVWDDEHIESEPDSPWHSSIAHSRRRVYSVRHEQKCQALKKYMLWYACFPLYSMPFWNLSACQGAGRASNLRIKASKSCQSSASVLLQQLVVLFCQKSTVTKLSLKCGRHPPVSRHPSKPLWISESKERKQKGLA